MPAHAGRMVGRAPRLWWWCESCQLASGHTFTTAEELERDWRWHLIRQAAPFN